VQKARAVPCRLQLQLQKHEVELAQVRAWQALIKSEMGLRVPHTVPCILDAALCDLVVVLLKPELEAVELLLCVASRCHLGDADWSSLAELAACKCTADKAVMVQLL
jgi:hypothetical protein